MVGRVLRILLLGMLVVVGLLLPTRRADAQSVRVYGNNPDAQLCFASARDAATFGLVGVSSRMPCSAALASGNLQPRAKAATHVNRGVVSIALGEHESALDDFDAAMRIHPDYGAIYLNRGNVFFIREFYDDAIAEYTKALDAEMDEVQVAYLNRGMAHEHLAQWDAAEADYRRALEIYPEWGVAMSKLDRLSDKRE
jgi:tetratricopeptide (TPR) repeat protein